MKTSIQCAELFTKPNTAWETAGTDTQFFIKKYSNGEVVIAFLGSNSKEDWKANFAFRKVPYKDMEIKFKVHRGFLSRWKEVRELIMYRVESLKPTCITVTGHSHGGALALLCMEDCWFRFVKSREGRPDNLKGKLHCITFGAPRVLGLMNYKKIKERWEGTVELHNGSDLVTCVPPACFLYRHTVKRTHIGEKSHWYKLHKVACHSISAYIETINKVNGNL